MAVPSITSLTPSFGPTGGRLLVEARGAGFRMPTPGGARGSTVAVRVGDRTATQISVIEEGRLSFLVPPGREGAADVTIENLDDAGVPIPGESVTLAGGFTYRLPALTEESDLTRVVRAVLRALKAEVIANVCLSVHTDFVPELEGVLAVEQLAELPGLLLSGPDLPENRLYGSSARLATPEDDGRVALRRPPLTVDLRFRLVGVADHATELLNLLAATVAFFRRNASLAVERDPAQPAAGTVSYELDVPRDSAFAASMQAGASNLFTFSGAFVVRGFAFEELAGLPGESVVARTTRTETVAVPSPRPLEGPAGSR
jgi:hypothetical protein